MKRIFTAVLTLCILLSISVSATETKSGPAVRVNGEILEFPDQQPYIDENNRTMVPVRFVIEALDAEAKWDGPNKSAIITKDDVCVVIKIGEKTMTVTEAGEKRTVTMDTSAVLNEGRTFIPVRFIAEALGVYVDWASYHSTACFYDDVLSPEQIAKLQAYEYTKPDGALGFEEYKDWRGEETAIKRFGEDRHTFSNFANAREHLYHVGNYDPTIRYSSYYFASKDITLTNTSTDNFFRMVAEEASSLVGYESERLSIEFLTDTSCLYQADTFDSTYCAVRGIAAVTLHVHPTKLNGSETANLVKMGFSQLYSDVTMYIDLDVHVNTMADAQISINTIVPLCPAY